MFRLIKNLPKITKQTYQGWKADNGSRLAAALTYYTLFSLAPMLIIAIGVAGLIWQRQAVQDQVLSQIQGLVGSQGRTFMLLGASLALFFAGAGDFSIDHLIGRRTATR